MADKKKLLEPFEANPIDDPEDKKMFFLCRKEFATGDDAKIDEKTYDTTSRSNVDLFPYLITYGYKKEKHREKESLAQCKNIIEKRKEYGLSPLIDPESDSALPLGCKTFTLEDFQKAWPMFIHGRGLNNTPVVWDKSGAMEQTFFKGLCKNPEDCGPATKRYAINNTEQLSRTKLKISRDCGHRVTKHYGVLDASQMGMTNVMKVKDIISTALADAQVMYPETLRAQFIVNTGFFFRAVWTVVKMFLHPDTREKIQLLGGYKSFKPVLAKYGITNIPKSFGGEDENIIIGGDSFYDNPKNKSEAKKDEKKTEEAAEKTEKTEPASAEKKTE